MPADLAIISEERDFTLATCSNAMLWSFRGEVNAHRVKQAQPVHEQLVRRYPKGFAVVTLVGDEVPLSMPDDARTLSQSITKSFQPHYCALCEVVAGTGFRGAIVRSILGGFRLFARVPCPSNTFADTRMCANWLAPLMTAAAGERTEPEALAQALERVRLGPGLASEPMPGPGARPVEARPARGDAARSKTR